MLVDSFEICVFLCKFCSNLKIYRIACRVSQLKNKIETGHLCLSFSVGDKGESKIKIDYDHGDEENVLIRRLSHLSESSRYSYFFLPSFSPVLF